MKKSITMSLVLAASLGLAACGEKAADDTAAATEDAAATVEGAADGAMEAAEGAADAAATAGAGALASIAFTSLGVRYALDASSPSDNPRIAPSNTLSTFTSST